MRDVKLWFAYNENKEVIKIGDADINKTYFCPCCGADVFPKATKSKKVTMHFCHVSGESCSDNGGESYIHKWIKTVLFTPNQSIKVNTKDGIKEYTVKEVEIEKRYETSQGDYIPDISVLTHEGENIFVEICNTNKKSIDKYWLKWFELGKMVIELKVKDVLDNNFELGILEPIYEDSDKFGRFKEKDYKELVGKKVDDKEKIRIKELYNDIYDYRNGKISIDKIFRNYVYCKCYIKEYVCETIVDDVIRDMNKYEIALKKNENYEKIMKKCYDDTLIIFGLDNNCCDEKVDILGVYCGIQYNGSYRVKIRGKKSFTVNNPDDYYFYSNGQLISWSTKSYQLFDVREGTLLRIKGRMESKGNLSKCRIEVVDENCKSYSPISEIICCKDCNKHFALTIKEVEWYNNKNFKLPKSCKKCRDKNKTK